MKHLAQLKKLNLPADEFAIFGSGPLAVRGIREANDLDIIAKPNLWKKLAEKYPSDNKKVLIGEIEIFHDWKPWFSNSNKLIEDSEAINGFPFVKLKYVLQWKKKMGRPKDIRDIELIESYLKTQNKATCP